MLVNVLRDLLAKLYAKKANYFHSMLLLLLLFHIVSCKGNQQVLVEQGVLDLRNQNLEKEVFKMNGTWEFYWNKSMKELKTSSPNFIQVPNDWTDFLYEGKKLSAYGFASYRIKILLPKEFVKKAIALKLKHVHTSYRLYVDRKLITQVGVPTKDASLSQPAYKQPVVVFFPQHQEIEIIIEVANFSYSKAGLLEPFVIGAEKNINLEKYFALAYDLFLLGVFSVMFIYYIGLFSLKRKSYSFLFFALFCLMFVLRTLTRGEMFLNTLFHHFPFELQIRLEYFSYYLAVPPFYWFLHILFEKQYKRKIGYVITAIVGVFALIVLFSPIVIFTKLNIYFQIFTMVVSICILFCAVQAVWYKEKNSLLFLITLIFFALTVLNDILYSNGIIRTFEMSSIGLFALVFVQSFMVSVRVSNSLLQIQELIANLENITRTNSRFVPETILSFLDKQSIIEIQLGDTIEKRMTILSAEAVNWTEVSTQLSAEDNFVFINSHLNVIGPIVRKHNGFMEKYLGNGFIAIFSENSFDAVVAAIEIQKKIKKHNPEVAKGKQFSIDLAMGIHVDDLVVGTIGAEEHIDTTIISNAVSCSSHLKSLGKRYEASIVVSEEVQAKLPQEYTCRKLGKINAEVKEESTTAYQVLNSFSQEDLQNKLKTIKDFHLGIRFYQEKNWQQAEMQFEKVLQADPQDKTTQYFLNSLRENPIEHL